MSMFSIVWSHSMNAILTILGGSSRGIFISPLNTASHSDALAFVFGELDTPKCGLCQRRVLPEHVCFQQAGRRFRDRSGPGERKAKLGCLLRFQYVYIYTSDPTDSMKLPACHHDTTELKSIVAIATEPPCCRECTSIHSSALVSTDHFDRPLTTTKTIIFEVP
jgi:hypothetical protein